MTLKIALVAVAMSWASLAAAQTSSTHQAKDGTNKGVGRSLTFADGRKLFLSETVPGQGESPKK